MTYDLFEYVAANNPYGARAIINKYGFSFEGVQTETDLGQMLREVVAEVGHSALADTIGIHPDKELIVEQYGLEAPKSSGGCGGGCSGCGKKSSGKSAMDEYVGNLQGATGMSLQQGNLFLIGAALILAVAIVSK